MPELPEVEVTMRSLRPQLIGRYVQRVILEWPRHTPNPSDLQAFLPGRTITGMGRRGKYITTDLNPADRSLLFHLGMSGRLAVYPAGESPDKHAHTIICLDNGRELRFSDARKFGRIYFVSDRASILGRLGPEPLSEAFSKTWLVENLARRKRAIKPLLLEQNFIAGLGNIYTDEVLHRSGIDPRRPANSLNLAEASALHASIRYVLTKAIERNGTSFDWVYPDGNMQEYLAVYGRGGELCYRCGKTIEKIVLAQRGTHFCPGCQT
ncbi:MAG: bifunctional DNA-formamidopyrimidine glycosylase/DNA-(apurinic or apyrimidinic site) lyase [Anaerolineales bacterium]|nr:bifunctional DNA-formamidopyrimidine glycosylase/DNA-(apurinic or apyrimidinic site) lyase [Anaerolineales bacterium]